jgi:hypothetical protein
MSGGGGGGTTYSEVQQTTSQLPEYAEPYFHDLMARAAYQSSLPYTPYGEQRIAGFDPAEQAAMDRMTQLGVMGAPQQYQQAMDIVGGIAGLGSGYQAGQLGGGYRAGQIGGGYQAGQYQPGYQAGQIDTSGMYDAGSRQVGFDPGTLADSERIQQYMSPYQQAVTDVEKRSAAQVGAQQLAQAGLQSAAAGGRGGYREGIQQAALQAATAQQLGDIQTRGSQAAYDRALQSMEADRQAQAQLEQFEQAQFNLNEQAKQYASNLEMQGFTANEAARQAQERFGQAAFQINEGARQAQDQMALARFQSNEAARQAQDQMGLARFQAGELSRQAQEQLAQSARGMQLGAAGQLAGLGGEALGYDISGAQMVGQIGQMRREQQQAALDMMYQDFLRQQSYPVEQLNLFMRTLYGAPLTPGQTQATYGPSPSYGQQALGALGGLYGLYQQGQAAEGGKVNPMGKGISAVGLKKALGD